MKSLRYKDVICPQNARKHQIETSVGLFVPMAMLGYFMCHCMDLTPLILRNKDTSIPNCTMIQLLKCLINALLVQRNL